MDAEGSSVGIKSVRIKSDKVYAYRPENLGDADRGHLLIWCGLVYQFVLIPLHAVKGQFQFAYMSITRDLEL